MRVIEMVWRGKSYSIPADQAFKVGEEVEDIATLAEIGAWGANPRMFKLARAYGAMLRFAGAKVSDSMVLEDITPTTGQTPTAASDAIKALIDALLSGAKASGGDDAPEKDTAS